MTKKMPGSSMSVRPRSCWCPPSQRGQATVEAGIVVALLVILTLGVVEFGRAWMVGNMITQAARDGGRTAAVVPLANRDSSDAGCAPDCINNATKDSIRDQVRSQIANVMGTTAADTFTVTTTQATNVGSGVNEVQIQVTGTVPYIFNLPFVGTSFTVNRLVTFRDEVRPPP